MSKRIMIPTIAQPDVPNVNNVVYSNRVRGEYIASINNGKLMIPLTLEQNNTWCKDAVISYDKTIGFVNKITDTYVIATLIDYEERYKDNPSIIGMMDECISRIHKGDIKAYMNYYADTDIEPDMVHTYVNAIFRILYFNLGNADPHDMSPVIFNPTKNKRHHKRK